MSSGLLWVTKAIGTGFGMSSTPSESGSWHIPLAPRTDATCRTLLALLSPFQIGFITSDDWGSYARKVPADMHLTGKIFTQRIERNNLTLRTRLKRLARKTIYFSRSIELHEKVIGALSRNAISTDWRNHPNVQ